MIMGYSLAGRQGRKCNSTAPSPVRPPLSMFLFCGEMLINSLQTRKRCSNSYEVPSYGVRVWLKPIETRINGRRPKLEEGLSRLGWIP